MNGLIARLCAAVEAAHLQDGLELAEVTAFARGFCASAACGTEVRVAALNWAAGYVQRETRKAAQYRRWLRAA